jgi:hypothetical protein
MSDQSGNAQTSEANGAGENPDTTQVQNPEGVLNKNRELLNKLKAEQAKRQEIEDKLNQIEQDRLANAGKKDELIEALKKQLKDKEETFKRTTQSFALKTVRQQVMDAARSMGAEKPELIEKLADLSQVGVADDFSVDQDALMLALGKVKEDAPMLFKKAVAAPRDGTPSNFVNGQKPIAQMSVKELTELYIKKAGG